MTRLSNETLANLPANVSVPKYDRRSVSVGWVHLGVGGFHRAHQAVYLDDLLALPDADPAWGLCGVGLLPTDAAMRDAMQGQDGLYTVVERSQDGSRARVVGSIIEYLFAPDDGEAVSARLAAPETRLVTLTITEGGYDASGSAARTLVRALDRRRRKGVDPFTILSCDNIQHNGDAARRMVLDAARAHDPALVAWIKRSAAFPNAMVDRITPQTTDADRQSVQDAFGVNDAWPVVCEPFRQWVIEDRFVGGRPALERVGAQFVPDVTPYETMKIRLLNGSHSAMGYLGYLAGFEFIHDVMADDVFVRFISALMDREVTPLLPPVPGVDLGDYKSTLVRRFANPAIGDQVARICLGGSAKVPKFLIPSLREALAQGRPARLLSLAVAGWLRYLSGTDEAGKTIKIEDDRADELQARAREGGADPRPLLALSDLFGDLGESPQAVSEIGGALRRLYADGARATLSAYLSQG